MNEFEIIERYFRRDTEQPGLRLGIGDDAALVDCTGTMALALDTLVAGVHFPLTLDPAAIGRRSLAVNLSDLAAMGARPRWFLLGLTLPAADAHWLEGFAAGLHGMAAEHAVTLVGGDLTRGPLCISIQVAGEVPAATALRRAGARAGDGIYVTGSLGDAAAGLVIAAAATATAADSPARTYLRRRFESPEPRISAGCALRGLASAAIDVSDGLLADLGRLLRASGCGGSIDVAMLPLSAAILESFGAAEALNFALNGGDDYELCFTVPLNQELAVAEALRAEGVTFTRIGQCEPEAGLRCVRGSVPLRVRQDGYLHFS